MKSTKIIVGLGLAIFILTSSLMALPNNQHKVKDTQTALIIDHETYLDINSLLCFVYNDGNFAYDNANVFGKTDGLYFPRGTKKTVIYSAGLWIAAEVNGEVRAATADYASEFVQGPMENGTFMPDSPAFRVYKIQNGDTPQSNDDYAEWPGDMGAPVDEFGNPELCGDQMCWSVFNDADSARHHNDGGSTEPLGLEVQHTSFAYGRSGIPSRIIFMKWLIINKGTNNLENTYVSLWCDPDLGNSEDDLVGCDTNLSLGYCYNGLETDAVYGVAPPAVGIVLLQGPLVDGEPGDSGKFLEEWYSGKRNLTMTSFTKSTNGTEPDSVIETYNCMKGLALSGDPIVDPSGDTTKFICAGEPVTSEGWVDESPDERRFLMSSGPFDMIPGDSQEIVAAIVVAQGSDRLSSVSLVKGAALYAEKDFDIDFDLSSMPDCGDANLDGGVNISDAVFLVNYFYLSGSGPNPLGIGDVNCDGEVEIDDIVTIINYIFLGGNAPCDANGDGSPDC